MSSITDFHTHILPSVDDGSQSIDESLSLLREELSQGVSRVVLTPHFYANHDSPTRFLKRRSDAEQALRDAANPTSDYPELIVGAEVHYFEGMSDCEHLGALAISGTDLILVEMPHGKWSDRMLSELESIRHKHALIPVIAHVDRYITFFNHCSLIDSLLDHSLLIQANADFFISRRTRRMALRLLSEGRIHFLGSDCHGMHSRVPNLGKALDVIKHSLGKQALDRLECIEADFFSV